MILQEKWEWSTLWYGWTLKWDKINEVATEIHIFFQQGSLSIIRFFKNEDWSRRFESLLWKKKYQSQIGAIKIAWVTDLYCIETWSILYKGK